MLGTKLLDVHGIGVVGRLGFITLPLQSLDLRLLHGHLSHVISPTGPQLGQHGRTQLDPTCLIETETLQVLQNGVLDSRDGHVHLLTGARVLLPAETVEVWIQPALCSAGLDHAVTTTAASAVDDALERMRVQPRLVLGLVAAGQDVLDRFERRLVRQWLVPTRMLDAVEGNHADVVAIAQDVVERLRTGRSLRQAGSCRHREAAMREFLDQIVQRVAARCVGVEGPSDVVGPFVVDDDNADVTAVHPIPGVLIAYRRVARRAAELGLLTHALAGFLSEVAGIELGNRRHDGVQQRAARGLVDVLRCRHQRSSGVAQGQHDLDIVGPRAGQAIDLMHDDVVDVALFAKPAQHGLQLRPVRRTSRLAAIDVLSDDLGVQALSRPSAGISLGMQRVAVLVVVGVGLIGG